MSDARETPVEELELSVRSTRLLLELGVETVGALLDLPSIQAPPLVVAELTSLLADMGLAYTGEWKTPPTQSILEANGSVSERWATIEEWLGEHHPSVLESFRPPAGAAAIAASERALGVSLPLEYKEFLMLHDGQEDLGPMVALCALLPVAKLASERDRLAKLLGQGVFDDGSVDDGIARVGWHAGWLPIGRFQRDVLVLDLAPADGGTKGQIFTAFVDDDARTIVASSFADLLSRYFRELQDGTIDLEDDASDEPDATDE